MLVQRTFDQAVTAITLLRAALNDKGCDGDFMDRRHAMTMRPIEDFHCRAVSAARFVLVNERIPRSQADCATCRARIERGYVRDPQTRDVYCNPACFGEHERMSMPAIVTRRVS
jgi:hypothetical protein